MREDLRPAYLEFEARQLAKWGKGPLNGATDASPLVLVEDLHHVYADGYVALRGIDLSIYPRECVAILGESGAGKTTLARHLNGLLRPTRGRVLVAGRDSADTTVAELATTTGYVFQNPLHQLFAETVEAELALGPLAQGWSEREAAARVEEMLVQLELTDFRQRHPMALSEGERRRVALAATLAAKPRLLVLDEPTVGQDHRQKARLGSLLRRLQSEGRAILVITHDVEFAFDHCPRFVVMADGRLLMDGQARLVVKRSDVLAAAALEPPQLARFGQILAPLGYSPDCLTIDEAVQELRRVLAGARR